MLPKQQTLLFPLLETLNDAGGSMRPSRVYDELAERVGLSDEDRHREVSNGAEGRPINEWERRVRNCRQGAVERGLVEGDASRRKYNLWELTAKARHGLLNARPGICITLFTTEFGRCVWGEAETAVGLFEKGSIGLIVTSPPFPLIRRKQYGNLNDLDHVAWLAEVLAAWKEKLSPDGSLIINTADVWNKGLPTISLYQERLLLKLVDELGYHLCQRLHWTNPSKLPSPAEWVTVRRVRVTPSVESVLWLSPTPHPKANNRAVLRPYSKSMERRLARGGEERERVRPSGHVLKEGSFAEDCGGSIPHSLLVAANTSSRDAYQVKCREMGLPVHPARFPELLPSYAISLTTDPGDLVVDIFAGSAKTGKVAERLKRRWATVERSLKYACGSIYNFGTEALRYVDEDLFAAALAH